jgi:hypothetical protein
VVTKKSRELVAGPESLDIEFVTVTWEIAADWLDKNDNNRNVRRKKVLNYKRDMLAGNWRTIGDPVRFDLNGKLVDGQHRLMALIEANEERQQNKEPEISIAMLVVRGVNPDDQVVMDTGAPRSAADQLKMRGYDNYPLLAATAKWLIFWDRRQLYAETTLKSVTHSEIMDYVENNAPLLDIVAEAAKLRTGIDMPATYVAVTYYICFRIEPEEAHEFFQQLSDGIGLSAGDPVLALRNRLRELRIAQSNLTGEQWLSLTIRTWNARREGIELRKLPVHRRGEPIPCPPAK